MKYFLVFFSLTGSVLSPGCVPDAPSPPKEGGGAERSGEVRLGAILRLPAAGPKVPLTLSNGTDQPFIYVTSYGEIVGFDYSLRRNGKDVPRDTPTPGPGLNPVFTSHLLKAGERLSFSYKLHRHFKLEPGEYDLQIVYRIYEGSTINQKNNATPAHFTLNYTLVVE